MKVKSVYFLLAAAILVIVSIFAINAMESAAEQKALAENRTKELAENRTKAQMEYISNLQVKYERILAEDPDGQELLNGKTSFKVYEIIYNESLIEDIYIVGFDHQKLKDGQKGLKIVNGTVCRFYIDTINQSVITENDTSYASYNLSSDLLVLKNEIHKEEDEISFDSSMSTNVWPGLSHQDVGGCRYSFRAEGIQNMNITSGSSKIPAMNYQLSIKKMTDNDEIHLTNYDIPEFDPVVLSANNNLSAKYWTEERKRDEHTLSISLPAKIIYPIYYLYNWDVYSGNNQTIVFDIDMIVEGLGNSTGPGELYGWRFIIATPPNLYYLSEDDMAELGFWAANDYGSYYPISCTIVRKGDWLEDVLLEKR